MYHVKDDCRCHDSCNLIYKALIQLLQTKSLNDITISDLSKVSTVGRATFYRHFDSIIDVLIWASDFEMEKAFKKFHSRETIPDFSNFFYHYWCQRSTLFEILVKINRSDIFLSSLEKYIFKYPAALLQPTQLRPKYHTYLISIWTVTIWSILNTWVITGKKETPNELTKIHLHNLIMPE